MYETLETLNDNWKIKQDGEASKAREGFPDDPNYWHQTRSATAEKVQNGIEINVFKTPQSIFSLRVRNEVENGQTWEVKNEQMGNASRSDNLPASVAAGASHLATVMGPVKGLFFEASIKLYNILIFV